MDPIVPASGSASSPANVPALAWTDSGSELTYSQHIQAVLDDLTPLREGHELAVVEAVCDLVNRARTAA
jgi:hypothetical protein